MKKLLLFMILIILNFNLFSDIYFNSITNKNGWNTLKLNGKVKELISIQYDVIELDLNNSIDKILKNNYKKSIYNFSQNGEFINLLIYDEKNNLITKEIFNDKSLIINKINYSLNGKEVDNIKYSYDNNKKLSEIISYNEIYKVKVIKNIMKINTYSKSNKFLQKTEYKLNSDGNIESITYNIKNMIGFQKFKYDNHKNISLTYQITPFFINNQYSRYKNIYENNNLIQIIEYDKKNNIKSKRNLKYDIYNNMVKSEEFYVNKLSHVLERIYLYY